MADNTLLNTGTGGDTIRDIDRSGVKTQVTQMDIGGASAEVLVTAGQKAMAASLPVVLASNQTPVPGTLTSPNGAAAGIYATISPYGYQRVTTEPSVLFADSFDGATIDTTDRWVVGGAVSQGNGFLTVGSGVANGLATIVSKPTFPALGLNLLGLAFVATLEATPLVTNTDRFFGFGVHSGTPSNAVPITDGIGFEFDGAGKLWASIWQNGVRSANSVDISASAVSGPVRYGLIFRTDVAFFYIGSTEVPVATISYTNPYIQALPLRFQTITPASPTGAPNTLIQAIGIHDTGHNNTQLSDGAMPWRKAKISAAGELMTALSSNGITNDIRGDGALHVSNDPSALLYDPFDTYDGLNTWQTVSIAPTVTNGSLSYAGVGTTASALSFSASKPTFAPPPSGFLQYGSIVTINAGAAITNNLRFWGIGLGNNPVATLPINNGALFELESATGNLLASVYSGAVRTKTLTLTRPTDGLPHRYSIFWKASKALFEIDGVYVGSIDLPNPQVGFLSVVQGSVNAATSPTTAPILLISTVTLADTSRNSQQISDATFPWRKAAVGKNGGLSVRGTAIPAAATSIAVGATGSYGPYDVSEAGNVTFIAKPTNAGTAVTGNPILIFEQSDDNVAWGPLTVVRADTNFAASTHTITGGLALNTSLMFDAGMEGVSWVRVRLTAAPVSNPLTVVIAAGGLAFSPVVTAVTQGPAANATASTANPILIGGTDGTNARSAYVKAPSTAPVAADQALVVGLSPNSQVAKGTQGAVALPVQDLKDSGRVNISITCYRAAGIITTEALFAAATFSRSADFATATTGVQFTATAGKRFRIQTIEVSIFGNAAAAVSSKLVLRAVAAAGTITNTSPIVAIWDVGSNVATTGNYIGPLVWTVPDGLEIIGGYAFGFTNLSSAATVLHTITLTGYEY